MPNEKRAIRSRLDFSKIPTATQIPNLIEVQRRSYERFLQMDKLPNERDDSRLAVGVCVGFSDYRFPRHLAAGLRRFLDRQLGVQVRPPERPASPAHGLRALRRDGDHQSLPARRRALPEVRNVQQEHARLLQQVRRPGEPAAEVRPAGVRRAGHDVLRAVEGDGAPDHLRQGRRDRQQDHPRHQGAGSLLRRHSADDAERHVHRERHGARDRFAVAPLAGRVF